MDQQDQTPKKRRRTEIRNFAGARFGSAPKRELTLPQEFLNGGLDASYPSEYTDDRAFEPGTEPVRGNGFRWNGPFTVDPNPTNPGAGAGNAMVLNAGMAAGTRGTVLNPNAGGNGTVLNPTAGTRGTVLNPNAGGNGTVLNPNAGGNGTVLNPNAGGNGTVLNPNAGGNGTVLNPNAGGNGTVLNPATGRRRRTNTAVMPQQDFVPEGIAIPAGTELFGKYTIQERLRVYSGEADLYLAENAGALYVAKVYRRKAAIKEEVVRKLLAIQSPYVAQIYDMGDYEGHTVEVIPYYQNGTLQGQTFSLEDLRGWIIPSLNEGLRVIHQQGIIHKDLKPSNIMLNNDRRGVSIIDFGISSVKGEGESLVITQTGRTPVYSAPETIGNLFLAESDYYSLGVTIFELFTGTLPYEGFTDEQRMRMFALQRIPCPDTMPEELRQLIWGLTYADLSNRENKQNPNRRWTYEETASWCRGEKMITPGDSASAAVREHPYSFEGKSYTDLVNLVLAFNSSWLEGKKQLYRGILRAYFENVDQTKATYCAEAEEEVSRNPDQEDIIFFRTLYRVCPELKQLVWMGAVFRDLAEFGARLLADLRNRDESGLPPVYRSALKAGALSAYCELVLPGSEDQTWALRRVESGLSAAEKDPRETEMLFYQLGYMLSGQRNLVVNGMSFQTVDEMTAYLGTIVNRPREFNAFYARLIDENDTLDSGFESWLTVLGKEKEIADWRSGL